MEEDVRNLLQARRYEAALERLLDVHQRKVFRMALAILRDPGMAEEITQEVFLKAWRAFPSYDGRAAPSTWLYTIARNACLSAARSQSYRRTTPIEAVAEPAAPNGAAPDLVLEQALSRLPETARHVITLFYYEQRSIKEVAAMLDLPEGTVKSHLHHARRALAKAMK
jgi:RNA polymerase sigma-70 factor (ECF subfamily)